MNKSAMIQKYFNENQSKKFRPGIHDCATFVAEWVRLTTGKDLTQDLVGKYKTIQEGKDALLEKGFTSHIQIAQENFEQIPVAMAQVGDVAVIEERAFGIVAGQFIFVLKPSGIGTVKKSEATMAFRIS